jgi:hypothetical protein
MSIDYHGCPRKKNLNRRGVGGGQRSMAATNQRRKSLDHELRELYEYNLLSVISAKAVIHLRTMGYAETFLKITT